MRNISGVANYLFMKLGTLQLTPFIGQKRLNNVILKLVHDFSMLFLSESTRV